ncbi:MAG: hypothetical protein HFJ29_01025 [Clostridia bacterium]|nr:hypothetical protein [Clostridia bacterium]
MQIENLVRDKVIAHIKTGTKSEKGLPKKLPFFNVEEDKVTSSDMVDIFKQLYPGQPKILKIRFVDEDPFSFKYKRYVNNKIACIGNGTKAITIGKNAKGNNEQIEVECSKECEHRLTGKCKLVGSLKFVLEGIEAGGVWLIKTTGGLSLSNIASEIVKYKKAGMSIVDVPFELKLDAQESIAYGTYYSLDLRRTDIKPQLTNVTPSLNSGDIPVETTKQIAEGKKETETETKQKENIKKQNKEVEQPKKEKEQVTNEIPKETDKEQQVKEDFSDIFYVVEISDILIQNKNFKKIILQDINSQDNEYILHPKASQDILKCGIGTMIKLLKSEIQVGKNIICKYEIKQILQEDGTLIDFNNELKEAV